MPDIAIIIPCHNEAVTIAKVVADFRRELPDAQIHVFDNCSTDDTASIARGAGAEVHFVPVKGKGSVVRQMFVEVEADVLVMVDGDDTYPSDRVHDLVQPVLANRAAMVVGTRLSRHASNSFRRFHVFGNHLVLSTINFLFKAKLTDTLSGYRAFSREFALTTPILSRGFEVETEITLHALEYNLPVIEIEVPYGERPAGSTSKLNTFRDGARVIASILRLYKDYRPLAFFGILGMLAVLLGIVAGVAVVEDWRRHGNVIGVSRAVFAALALISGSLSLLTGAVLDTVNRRSREVMVLTAGHIVRESRRRLLASSR